MLRFAGRISEILEEPRRLRIIQNTHVRADSEITAAVMDICGRYDPSVSIRAAAVSQHQSAMLKTHQHQCFEPLHVFLRTLF